MPDPIDERVDIGPGNEKMHYLPALYDLQDPLAILVAREEETTSETLPAAEKTGLSTHTPRIFIKRKSIMTRLFETIKIRPEMANVGRAAQKSIASTLNFIIAATIAKEVRIRANGVPDDEPGSTTRLNDGTDVTPLLAKYNNILEVRNEVDEAARGKEVEKKQREEQGFDYDVPPMELAGKLKVIRDHFAEILYDNARMMRDAMDPKGRRFRRPSDLAPTLTETLGKQIANARKVSDAQVKALAEAHDLQEDEVRRLLEKQNEQSKRFLENNKEEMLELLNGLLVTNSNNQVVGTDEAEALFHALPPIYQAKMYRAADMGLYYEQDNQRLQLLNGNPDASGNLADIYETRTRLHRQMKELMDHEPFFDSVAEAVRNGARWPTMPALNIPQKKAE